MTRLKMIEGYVRPILEEKPETRIDDLKLYLEVLKAMGRQTSCSLEYYLTHKKEFPSYESVSRTRRKLQELYKDLAVESLAREECEQDYIYYAITD